MATPDSQFEFLRGEWPMLFDPAARAESLVYPDSRSSCFHARRALELAVHWLYKHDSTLKLPYQDHLSALIHEPSFRNAVGPAVFAKIKVIKDLGNLAVHSHKSVRQFDALTATKELFHVMFWLARTYARGTKPADGLSFNADLLPRAARPQSRHWNNCRIWKTSCASAMKSWRICSPAGKRSMPSWRGYGSKSLRRRNKTLRGRTTITILKPKPVIILSICCSRKPAGHSLIRKTGSSQLPACPIIRAKASSTTSCGATTASRWALWKPNAPSGTRVSDNSRRNSMRIVWSSNSGSGR
jgi:Domain of unknown function (DUF4145)